MRKTKPGAPGAPPSHRQLRVGETVRHALIEALQRETILDPALDGVLVTVPEVRMSPDLKLATAYVMPLGGANVDAVVAALDRASGFLRGAVARRVQMRSAPSLRFRADDSFARGDAVDRLLASPEVRRDVAAGGDTAGGDGGDR